MVNRASASWRSVPVKIFQHWRGETRSTKAESIVAIIQEVPEADNQLKLKMAGYGEMAGVTGGMRAIWLCNPAHCRGIDKEFSLSNIGCQPHSSTQSPSSR